MITSAEQWDEWPSKWSFPVEKFPHLCFAYMGLSVLYLTMHCSVIRCLRGHMKGSWVALETWPRIVRLVICFVIVLVFLCPFALFLVCHVAATIMSAVEAWPWMDSFEYVMCNMVAIGPMNSLTPASTLGNVVDILVSTMMLILSSTIIGFVAGMGIVGILSDFLCAPRWRNFVGVVVTLMVAIVVLTFIGGLLLSVLEGSDIWDSFLFLAGLICGIGNALTDYAPQTDRGNFFAALCSMLELAFGGAIVGILASHPKILGFVVLLEGAEEEVSIDHSDDPKATVTEVSSELVQADLTRSSELLEQGTAEVGILRQEASAPVEVEPLDEQPEEHPWNEHLAGRTESRRVEQSKAEQDMARSMDRSEIQKLQGLLQESAIRVEKANEQHLVEIGKLQQQMKESNVGQLEKIGELHKQIAEMTELRERQPMEKETTTVTRERTIVIKNISQQITAGSAQYLVCPQLIDGESQEPLEKEQEQVHHSLGALEREKTTMSMDVELQDRLEQEQERVQQLSSTLEPELTSMSQVSQRLEEEQALSARLRQPIQVLDHRQQDLDDRYPPHSATSCCSARDRSTW